MWFVWVCGMRVHIYIRYIPIIYHRPEPHFEYDHRPAVCCVSLLCLCVCMYLCLWVYQKDYKSHHYMFLFLSVWVCLCQTYSYQKERHKQQRENPQRSFFAAACAFLSVTFVCWQCTVKFISGVGFLCYVYVDFWCVCVIFIRLADIVMLLW